eukprot:CAMPEP_0172444816 /NCGR_PEP_ID=MMETSP1065-20121228/4821_1 /TAXON_ID=265537 /ORGANISM="Amphiprora paludosa, Strain CCMP125" /LENGTH=231 /DNA_ID=CAMNT_0013195517 /DNA_START=34 /DNA_END=726 /DNA_ORIENTATION=-
MVHAPQHLSDRQRRTISLIKQDSDPALLKRESFSGGQHKKSQWCDESQSSSSNPSRRRMSRKRVRFGAHQTYLVDSFSRQDDLKAALWYSNQEQTQLRATFLEDSRIEARSNRPQQQHSSSSSSVMLQTFVECTKGQVTLTHDLSAELGDYLHQCHHTGLERMAARQIYNDKKQRRALLIQAVLDIQERHHHDRSSSYSRQSSALRFACETISFTSILFAHQIAVASVDCV